MDERIISSLTELCQENDWVMVTPADNVTFVLLCNKDNMENILAGYPKDILLTVGTPPGKRN